MFKATLYAAVVVLLTASLGLAQKRLAVVNGETVTEDQVKKAAADELENLQLKKMQAEIGFQRDEQSILERTLASIVDDKLIAAEAKKRGITTQALLTAEVDSKAPAPTDKDVNAFYEANKTRINVTGDEALRQIRLYLAQQQRDAVYDVFVNKLRSEGR